MENFSSDCITDHSPCLMPLRIYRKKIKGTEKAEVFIRQMERRKLSLRSPEAMRSKGFIRVSGIVNFFDNNFACEA